MVYKFCYSVLGNILQANVGTVIERATYVSYRVHTCYSAPFCAAVLQYTKLFICLLMKTSAFDFVLKMYYQPMESSL